MFNKTRIFITIAEKDNFKGKGGCFFLDVPNILPIQKGQSISFKDWFAKVNGILWLTEHQAMGIYTDIVELEKDKVEEAINTLLYKFNFEKIGG